MASGIEIEAMRRAVVLSAFGVGTVSPNPPVGCVILDRDGWVAGEGYHERKGEPHAEVHALMAAGERARGGTAVVTLEPCNHHGRTPPCRQALVDAGVARAVVALIDPTSRGEGGVAALRAAGVEVEVGVLADEALIVLGPWLAALERQRPFVTWVYAVEGDGQVVGLGSASDSFVNVRMDVRHLRAAHDAVMYEDSRVFEGVQGGHNPDVFSLPVALGPPWQFGSRFAAVLAEFSTGGVRSLLLDGGLALSGHFLANNIVDKLVGYVATGGASASPLSAWQQVKSTGLQLEDIAQMGRIVRVVARRRASRDGMCAVTRPGPDWRSAPGTV